MAGALNSLLTKVLPPKRGNPAGVSVTPTYNASAPDAVLTAPTYREHQTDLLTARNNSDSRALIRDLLKSDPDMSAAMNAFLTVANTVPVFLVRNPDTTLDEAGQDLLNQILTLMFVRNDYTKGFKMPASISSLSENMRYMVLASGGIGGELVISKEFFPTEVRLVDLGKIEWKEPLAGQYVPQQSSVTGELISLDIPNFFTAWFRRDPNGIYSHSPFISAINTIAARQQVINDLYRIMRITGYPRMEAKVMEEVVLKNMPPDIKADEAKKREYMSQVIGSVQTQLQNLRADQIFVHTDSIETGMMNEKAAGVTMDITSVIQTLNSQNQAGLKTMATIIGRGESGVNTASVEARIFSLSAQDLNEPLALWWSQALTLALRLNGSQSYVECYYLPVEMRSETELETQMLVKSQRLKDDLSLGAITDVEYHLWMYNRLPPKGAPQLSGTGFATQKAGVDTTAISPNGDPVGRSASAPGGNKGSRDNKSKPQSAK